VRSRLAGAAEEAKVREDFETLQVHAGYERADAGSRARAVPIVASAGYVFESFEEAAAVFSGTQPGNQYGRMQNPTVQVLADRLTALEGGAAALALASGQAATALALLTVARPGAEVVISSEVFGGTLGVARKVLQPWGVTVRVVPPTPDAVRAAAGPDTVAVWVETVANPSGTVPDLPALAEVAHAAGAPLMVDNTFGCAGFLCRPIDHGADVVMHSATKWINGHGTALAGALIDAGRFDWNTERFSGFRARDGHGRSYLDKGGHAAFHARAFDLGLATMGMTLSPFAAFLALQGLETLSLRARRSCETALALARWLESVPGVERVVYPGLPSHPSHDAATRMLSGGFGGVLAFELAGREHARACLDALTLVSRVANLGESRTLAIHPWTTTHAGLTEEARRAAGVTPGLVRVSVGLESVEAIQADLAQALAAAARV